jgi:tRNA (adenine37-N6)-methyltransferase
VLDVDLLDGTPILDIKPYVPYTDAFPDSGSGWLTPAAGDPGRSFNVEFSAEAEAQLQWIASHTALPLRERIVNTLLLGPQPHPYRRIKRHPDGSLVLAVQDWRVDFSVEQQQITVSRIRSGYNATQLARQQLAPDDPVALHQAFATQAPRTAGD